MDDSKRGGKGRGRGRGRGSRGQRKQSVKANCETDAIVQEKEVENTVDDAILQQAKVEEKENNAVIQPQTIDMESDISQLEAPTFTTLSSRGPPEPMTKLKWNHKVSLIGEKVLNPMIHCCDQCFKPILIYGRMIPCKHVFCLKCAREEPLKTCPRCKEKVIRVEQSGLGTVFMCSHGGTRYGIQGCRRTYLSQRDLQAHINHRHVSSLSSSESKQVIENKTSNVVQRKQTNEQPSSRQTTRQASQFVSSMPTVPSPSISNSNLGRNNANPPNIHQDQPPSQLQQPLISAMIGNMVHQQPQMTSVSEMYFNPTLAQQQQYVNYAGTGQQQNPSVMQNYGSIHQPPNSGMSMMMAQQSHMSRPPPPQGYFTQYSQPYGQMSQHYPSTRQYDQQNFNTPPNVQQWNQQYYR